MSVSKGRRQPDVSADGKQDSSEGGTVKLKPDTVGEQKGTEGCKGRWGKPPSGSSGSGV